MFKKKDKQKIKAPDHKNDSGTDLPDRAEEPITDDYDGYYDDVLPPDLDEVGETVDKNLVKKIIGICAVLLAVVSVCVVILYI